MEDNSGEFSDELDEFEESIDEAKLKAMKNQTTYSNKPYDEAFEISQDLSMAESFDARDKAQKEKKLKNDKYDEAVEVSQSLDYVNLAAPAKSNNVIKSEGKESKGGMEKNSEQTKSQSILNRPFDEALEFSHSGSDESVDTQMKKSKSPIESKNEPHFSSNTNNFIQSTIKESKNESLNASNMSESKEGMYSKADDDDRSSSDGENEESYENIEGAYNPNDYKQLNVAAEVRDLFQYIERYKPQEVELETPLKCFIPEYIPAIGELDPFLKVPRPDDKEDGLGLRFLDEPASNQSDPTVLELQLRAKSKKLQYGDIVVRSIEYADKNPNKIEKWINDINELHRSKPPPQVNYKKNMPDFDKLMEVWPEEFESILKSVSLPSPDLDLSLLEYVKVLCSIVDIPVYENPIESLHLLFTLFIEFRNNPHFNPSQNDYLSEEKGAHGENDYNYDGADVLQIDQGGHK